jgi:hypothetical protein
MSEWRADIDEASGVIRRLPEGGHRIAGGATDPISAAAGNAALVFDADLVNGRAGGRTQDCDGTGQRP